MDREAAEDAVHDALEKVLRGRRQPDDLLAYTMRAVRNAAIDAARRHRRRRNAVPREDLLEPSGGEPCEIRPSVLTAAFAELSRDQRETIWLHLYADLSFQEIAALRGRSLNTVASWYRRGIARLRSTLEVNDEED